MRLQQLAKRFQARRDALAVIQPIDADHQHAPAGRTADFIDDGLGRGARHQRAQAFNIDADREGVDAVMATLGLRGDVLRVPVPLEVEHIPGALHADQVVRRQGPHQLPMLRNAPNDVGRRQRNMVEETHALRAAERAQRLRERDEMVVVDPQDVAVPEHGPQMGRKYPVHGLVRLEVRRIQIRPFHPLVEDGPEHRIREPRVVALVIGPAEIDLGQRRAPERLGPHAGRVGFVDRLAAPAEP